MVKESGPSHTPGEPNILSAGSAEESSPQAGSLPVASDLYPSAQPQSTNERGRETNLQYQERRLKERRAWIDEKERIMLRRNRSRWRKRRCGDGKLHQLRRNLDKEHKVPVR